MPTPAFRALFECAVRKSDADIMVASQQELEALKVWSWWRRGGIELGDKAPLTVARCRSQIRLRSQQPLETALLRCLKASI